MPQHKVIIIDDGSSVNQEWRGQFEESGWTVRIFRESNYLLSIIAKEEPDLLILGMSNLWLDEKDFVRKLRDWLHRIRHIDRFSTLPIILISGRRLSSDSVLDLSFLGVEKIIPLPISTPELMAEVRSIVDISGEDSYYESKKFKRC